MKKMIKLIASAMLLLMSSYSFAAQCPASPQGITTTSSPWALSPFDDPNCTYTNSNDVKLSNVQINNIEGSQVICTYTRISDGISCSISQQFGNAIPSSGNWQRNASGYGKICISSAPEDCQFSTS